MQFDRFYLDWIGQKVVQVDCKLVLDVLSDMWCAVLQIAAIPSPPTSG
ncbi:MAG TPA: hypothetical protein VGX03_39415 [Candidatus Binatia bacterium]|jgi:hypothetical protein|nr:hypothetical protein [Candidatus Binatia bacterium]